MKSDRERSDGGPSESRMRDPWSCYEDENAACGPDDEAADEENCGCCC